MGGDGEFLDNLDAVSLRGLGDLPERSAYKWEAPLFAIDSQHPTSSSALPSEDRRQHECEAARRNGCPCRDQRRGPSYLRKSRDSGASTWTRPYVCSARDGKVPDDVFLKHIHIRVLPRLRDIYFDRSSNWRLIGHALNRRSQIDLRTVEPRRGSRASTLRYRKDEKRFYLANGLFQSIQAKYAAASDVRAAVPPLAWEYSRTGPKRYDY